MTELRMGSMTSYRGMDSFPKQPSSPAADDPTMPSTTDRSPRAIEAGHAYLDRRGQRWLVARVDRPLTGDEAQIRVRLQFAPPDTRAADYLMSEREFRVIARARGFRPEACEPA
jgi:hypothetical protein